MFAALVATLEKTGHQDADNHYLTEVEKVACDFCIGWKLKSPPEIPECCCSTKTYAGVTHPGGPNV